MPYRVIAQFADLMDGKHLYNAGDTFPRAGFTVDKKRIAELEGGDNRAGHPLIERVPEPSGELEKPVKKERVRKRA